MQIDTTQTLFLEHKYDVDLMMCALDLRMAHQYGPTGPREK